ncbi:MAG: hypothetical protein IPL88_00800 [Rhizobiales bacterium]|nr:hypothetical protein [Hyphomicrobiales bacterium]
MRRFVSLILLVGTLLALARAPSTAEEAGTTVRTNLGDITLFVGLTKSTHVGAFDVYVGPAARRALRRLFGGGAVSAGPSGRPRWLDLLLPDGSLPADASWSYKASPGVEFGASIETPALAIRRSAQTRLSLIGVFDFNRLRVRAPSGLGVLIDPTTLDFTTNYFGVASLYETALWSHAGRGARHTVFGGVGVFAYLSDTTAFARSDFLRVRIADRRRRIAPIASLAYEVSRADGTAPRAVSVHLRAFPTDHFLTLSASVRASLWF